MDKAIKCMDFPIVLLMVPAQFGGGANKKMGVGMSYLINTAL